MANYIENLGLDFLIDSSEGTEAFINCVASTGELIIGYNDLLYFNKHFGKAQFIATGKLKEEEDKNLIDLLSLDTHCAGLSCWKVRVVHELGINSDYKKKLMVKKMDGTGMAVVNVVNADVLPTFEEDTVINMQMIAFPELIRYYADEDAFEESLPEGINGKRLILAPGSIFPTGMFSNTDIEDDSNNDNSNDDVVNIHAEVKELRKGRVRFEDIKNSDGTEVVDEFYPFISCIVDTCFGELEIIHTIDMITEEDIANLKVGAVVNFYGILSGDVAINKYEHGIIKDHETNLKALSYVFSGADPERIRRILSDDLSYYSEASNKGFDGPEAFINRIKYIHENGKKSWGKLATISDVKEPYEGNEYDLGFNIGERCFVLRYEGEENYSAIVFIENDENDSIKRIYVSVNPRYVFKLDESLPEPEECMGEFIKDASEAMIIRARFHSAVNDDIEEVAILESIENDSRRKHAVQVVELIENNENLEELTKNSIKYFYVSGLINKIYNHNWKLDKEDCFNGTITFIENAINFKNIADALEIGRQLSKDFLLRSNNCDITDELFKDEFVKALMCAEKLGELYADTLETPTPILDRRVDYLEAIGKAYEKADFEVLFTLIDKECIYESQWVLTPLNGKYEIIKHLRGKAQAVRKTKAFPTYKLIQLVGNINTIKDADIIVNGEQKHGSFGLWYEDKKICLLLEQENDGEKQETVIDIKFNEKGLISRFDLCMPELFCYQDYVIEQEGDN